MSNLSQSNQSIYQSFQNLSPQGHQALSNIAKIERQLKELQTNRELARDLIFVPDEAPSKDLLLQNIDIRHETQKFTDFMQSRFGIEVFKVSSSMLNKHLETDKKIHPDQPVVACSFRSHDEEKLVGLLNMDSISFLSIPSLLVVKAHRLQKEFSNFS